jgi:predicted nuclease of predicted toxin-antitoxin system
MGSKKGRRNYHPRGIADPIANRIARLADALALPKFADFRDRFVVFADPAHIDAVWAGLIAALPFACCVLPLEELFGDSA